VSTRIALDIHTQDPRTGLTKQPDGRASLRSQHSHRSLRSAHADERLQQGPQRMHKQLRTNDHHQRRQIDAT
jgi:hypothetical protein